jgi:NAD(P)-dependent dehydrogenase (short-subunit alcohol dehydrogenase family)
MADGLLAGKVILLTGGADGIGRECALAYAREGANVAIADINSDKAKQTAGDLAQEGLAIACDVGVSASVERAVEASIERFAKLDAVHNNAGLSSPSKPLHETTEEE